MAFYLLIYIINIIYLCIKVSAEATVNPEEVSCAQIWKYHRECICMEKIESDTREATV